MKLKMWETLDSFDLLELVLGNDKSPKMVKVEIFHPSQILFMLGKKGMLM